MVIGLIRRIRIIDGKSEIMVKIGVEILFELIAVFCG